MGGEAGGSACFISIWESAARRSTAEALVGANSCLHEVAGALKFQGHILPRAMFFVAFPRCFGRWLLCNCLLTCNGMCLNSARPIVTRCTYNIITYALVAYISITYHAGIYTPYRSVILK